MDGKSIFVVGSFVAACSVKVDRLPRAGESLLAESFNIEAGGKGFNIAIAAHRLGTEVDGIFAVGSDAFADFARTALARAGLPADMLAAFSGPTGAGVGFVDRQGENCIAVSPAANRLLSAGAISAVANRVRRARLVVAQFEVGDAPICAAFALAREGGAQTILNPSPFRLVSPEILRQTDMIVVNRTEATALLAQFEPDTDPGGIEWERLAGHLFARDIATLVVTLGGDGLQAWTASGEAIRQPAFPVTTIDTIGAGDACLGGIISGLAEGSPLRDSLRRGAACGAMIAARSGLLDALPNRVQLAEFIEGAR